MSSVSLAEDIIIEILSRLPVRSLLRFKCVCKEWQELIENPVFISKHFNQEANHYRLLVQYVPRDDGPCSFALFPDKNLSGTPPVHEDLCKPLEIGQIFGPVNGLFFLHLDLGIPCRPDNRMALWNPATRQLKRLLCPKPMNPSHCSLESQIFGFGFDCLSNDYKVIWFCSYWDDEIDTACLGAEATIYSLSKDAWTSPLSLNCKPSDSLCSTYKNGAYYWASRHMEGYNSILSFDMANEVFRNIQGPTNPDSGYDFSLGSFVWYNDFLALLISDFSSCSRNDHGYLQQDQVLYYIWIMKEEGCWVKLLTIGPCQDWGLPVGVWNNNEILFDTCDTGRVFLYNVDSSEKKDLGLQSIPSDTFFHTYSYRESLVSIKGGNRIEDWKVFVSSEDESKHMSIRQKMEIAVTC